MNDDLPGPTVEDLKAIGLTDDEIKEYEAGELYDGLHETFTGRVISPSPVQLKVKALMAERLLTARET